MGTFLEALEDLVKSTESKANEKMNDFREEINKLDLSTDEGYSKYMNFLADLRIKASKYNTFFKTILGEDVSTLIDRIAQEATDQYMKAKKEREEKEAEALKAEEARKAEQARNTEVKKPKTTKFDISSDHQHSENDPLRDSINRIVDKYVLNELLPAGWGEKWVESIKDELVKYTYWLHNTDLK